MKKVHVSVHKMSVKAPHPKKPIQVKKPKQTKVNQKWYLGSY